ncbi:MAG: hydratase, partial [Brachymonas sp.]|nr:hydratase [Brachymonas sp.]
METSALLHHLDNAQLWPSAFRHHPSQAYAQALEVRDQRIERGEQPRGYKIGFTNHSIWARYNVSAPIWGSVYSSTLLHAEGEEALEVSLQSICQPRLEPEAVLCLAKTPPKDCSLEDLFQCLDWIAPGFEIVQCHLPNWKFTAADAIADGSLHARLIVGRQVKVKTLAVSAQEFSQLLAQASVDLSQQQGENWAQREHGQGSAVLDSPLHALHYFLQELRLCPDAPDVQSG